MISLRLTILAICFLGLVAWIVVSRKTRQWAFALGVGLWLVNVAMFQFVRLFDLIQDARFLNYWSLGIHLHGALTLAGVGLIILVMREDGDGFA